MLDGLSAEIIISWIDSFFLTKAKSTSYILDIYLQHSHGTNGTDLVIWMIQQNFEQGFAELPMGVLPMS